MFTEEAWERFQFYHVSKSEHSRFACNGCKKSEENGDDLICCEGRDGGISLKSPRWVTSIVYKFYCSYGDREGVWKGQKVQFCMVQLTPDNFDSQGTEEFGQS